MTATLIVVLCGGRLAYPSWLQTAVLSLIGISVGGSLTPGLLDQATLWLPSVMTQVAVHLAALAIGCLTMRGLSQHSTGTAFLASYPGHLVMVLTAATSRDTTDSRIVAIAQSLRLVALVAAVPLALGGAPTAEATAPSGPLEPVEAIVVVSAGLLGISLARLAHMPAPPLMGGIMGAGGAALLGFSIGPLPDMTGDGLLVIVGTMIGARFTGTSRRALLVSIPQCGLTVCAVLLTVAAAAWPASKIMGVPFGQMLLAYSPGGADVMPLLALSQGYDAVYVAVHHGARLLVMAVILPITMNLPFLRS